MTTLGALVGPAGLFVVEAPVLDEDAGVDEEDAEGRGVQVVFLVLAFVLYFVVTAPWRADV